MKKKTKKEKILENLMIEEYSRVLPKAKCELIEKLKKNTLERIECGREVVISRENKLHLAKIIYVNHPGKWFLVQFDNGITEGFKFSYIDIKLGVPFGNLRGVNECSERVFLKRTEEEKQLDKEEFDKALEEMKLNVMKGVCKKSQDKIKDKIDIEKVEKIQKEVEEKINKKLKDKNKEAESKKAQLP